MSSWYQVMWPRAYISNKNLKKEEPHVFPRYATQYDENISKELRPIKSHLPLSDSVIYLLGFFTAPMLLCLSHFENNIWNPSLKLMNCHNCNLAIFSEKARCSQCNSNQYVIVNVWWPDLPKSYDQVCSTNLPEETMNNVMSITLWKLNQVWQLLLW